MIRTLLRTAFALAVSLALAVPALPQSASSRHPDAPPPASAVGEGATVVQIPLADGVILSGDLYLPKASGRHPVLMEVTPYGRRSTFSAGDEHQYWTEHGYALLIVDARGIGGSGGDFNFMTDARRDGPQLVAWAARQPWSSGKVGMRGSSYSGTYPIQTAVAAPKALACISPNASFQSAFDGPPYLGGGLMLAWALSWTTLVDREMAGRPIASQGFARPVDYDRLLRHRPLATADVAMHGREVRVYRQILAHQTFDAFWAEGHLSVEDYRRIGIPALAFTGWYDTTLTGSIANYRAMRALAASADDQWLVVGPWDHAHAIEGGYSKTTGQPVRRVGVQPVEDQGFLPGQRMAREFFDWCLKGTAPRPTWPAVQMFVPGQDRWLHADRLPVQGITRRSLFLGSQGRANAPQSDGTLTDAPRPPAMDRYIHDPSDPVRSDVTVDGRKIMLFGPQDVSRQLQRPDVLTYSTGPLPTPLTILGNATLTLQAETDAPDTDFMALLEDVAPDGSAVRLGSGWTGVLRTRYRNGPGKFEAMAPGETTALRINLLEIGHTLRTGHRLRLSVFSSAYPFISVNPNTGLDIATDDSPPRRARQTVRHGVTHPSVLTLEVLETR
jgi:putative CocE/NonD family hydrolase